ncbi:MAG: type II secretion system protein [Patescibacteria group bacterium]|jgi:prepilin-type N-terminal cleavage/methylation domain-containing protein
MNVSKKGFSLLELLVVIGIIAVLLAIGAASYSSIQRKSRDAKRRGDLKTLQQSMEQYYAVCGNLYPTVFPGTGVNTAIVCAASALTILPTGQIPFDPKDGTAYDCSGTCDNTQFTLCADAEIESSICVSNQQ